MTSNLPTTTPGTTISQAVPLKILVEGELTQEGIARMAGIISSALHPEFPNAPAIFGDFHCEGKIITLSRLQMTPDGANAYIPRGSLRPDTPSLASLNVPSTLRTFNASIVTPFQETVLLAQTQEEVGQAATTLLGTRTCIWGQSTAKGLPVSGQPLTVQILRSGGNIEVNAYLSVSVEPSTGTVIGQKWTIAPNGKTSKEPILIDRRPEGNLTATGSFEPGLNEVLFHFRSN